MAEEYRIDISLGATDSTGPAFQSASKRVSAFEKSMQRTEKQLNRMDRTRWQLTIYALDRASSVITAINRRAFSLTRRAFTITLRAADYATRPIRAVGNLLTSTLGLLGAAGGTWAGIVYPLQMSGELEQTQIAFETMLGDAEKAHKFLSEAQQFAVATPFDMSDVVDSSRLMLAFGFQAEKVLPMLETIGNAAAGLGAGSEGIERMVRALGQMQAKGRVQAEELLQLQELGVPIAEILNEQLGLTAEQVGNIGELALDSGTVIDAILRGLDTRFGGLMDTQSRSLNGLLSTIKDTFNTRLLLRWGEGLRTGIQPHLQRLADWLDEHQETLERWGSTLESAGGSAANWIAEKAQGAYEWIQELVNSPEWQEAEGVWEHIQVAWDKWWNEGGSDWVHTVGSEIGGALKEGVKAGFGTGWDIFKSVQGTSGGTALDLWLLSQMAPGIMLSTQIGSKVWGWLRNVRGGAAAVGTAASASSAAASAAASTASALAGGAAEGVAQTIPIYGANGEILASVAQSADDVARAASTGSRLVSGLRSIGSTLGRYAGPIGAIVSTGIGLMGVGSAEDKGEAIGSAIGSGLGGWGGAAGGAAIGAAAGPIGAIIGGLIGGLAGGWGGGKLGGWLGDKATPDTTVAAPAATATTTTTPVVVQIEVTGSPTYKIETKMSDQDVVAAIRMHQHQIANELADDLADMLPEIFANLSSGRRRSGPVYQEARIAEF